MDTRHLHQGRNYFIAVGHPPVLGRLGIHRRGGRIGILSSDRAYRREYGRRLLEIRRIPLVWYLVIFLAYPALNLLVMLINHGAIRLSQQAQDLIAHPLSFVQFFIFIFFFGPLPEELVWRGFALDRLQQRINAMPTTLGGGTDLGAVALAVIFITGTYQSQLGMGTFGFWHFMLSMIVISFFFAWIFNNTRCNTVSAVLLYFVINLTGNLLDLSPLDEMVQWIGLLVLVLLLILFQQNRNLSRSRVYNKRGAL